MTDIEMTVQEREAELIDQGRKLIEQRREAEELTAKLKAAKAEWEKANAQLIQAEKDQRKAVEDAEDKLRWDMLNYHYTTHSKRFHEALEIRMISKAEYTPEKLLLWLLNAPRQLAVDLLTLDTKKVETWLKDNADEHGAIASVKYCDPVPAVIVERASAAILSKGLATLPEPKPVVTAVSDIATIVVVDNPTMVLTAPPEAIKPNDNIGDIPF